MSNVIKVFRLTTVIIIVLISCYSGKAQNKISNAYDTSIDKNVNLETYDTTTDFYTPTGLAIFGKKDEKIGEFKKRIGVGMTYMYLVKDGFGGIAQIDYKILSDSAVMVSTKHPESIKKYLKSFNFKQYMTTWRVEIDLEKLIEKKILTDKYVLNVWGTPNHVTKSSIQNDIIEIWHYTDYDLILAFINGFATSYKRY